MKLPLSFLTLLLLPAPAQELYTIQRATQPHAAARADGSFACAFILDREVQISCSTDDGNSWSVPAKAIDSKCRMRGGAQRGPRVGMDEKKGVYVTAPVCL